MSETEIGIFKQILQGKLDFESEPWPSISDSAKDLIRKMLERNPKKRLTAHEVLCKTLQFSLNRDLGVLGLNKFQHSDYWWMLLHHDTYVTCGAGHPWIVDDRIAPDKPLDSAVLSRLKQFSAMNKLKKMALRVRFLQMCISFLGLYYWFRWKKLWLNQPCWLLSKVLPLKNQGLVMLQLFAWQLLYLVVPLLTSLLAYTEIRKVLAYT